MMRAMMLRSTVSTSLSLGVVLLASMALGCGADSQSTKSVGVDDPVDPCRLALGGSEASFRCTPASPSFEKKVDILFVVDDTTVVPQARLAASMEVFVEAVREAEPQADLRIGVTTTDNGNPACSQPLGDGGVLDAKSCRAREEDFSSAETFAAGCTDHCMLETLELLPTTTSEDPESRVRPWIEAEPHASNLPDDVSLAQALACVIPRGDRGCPFRSPAQVALRVAERAKSPSDAAYGFMRPWSRRIVVIVSAGLDCSVNPEGAAAFELDGPRALWSDPEADAPTQAACWNAGVACEGDAQWSCDPVNRYPDGGDAAVVRFAALHPIEDLYRRVFEAWYGEVFTESAELFVLAGVPTDWTAGDPVPYAPAPTPDLELELGVAPLCDVGDTAVPPAVRMLSFAEGSRGDLHSVCRADYADHALRLAALVDELLLPTCMPACVADVDEEAEGLQTDCVLEIEWLEEGVVQRDTVPLCMAGDVVPQGALVCWSARTGNEMDPACIEDGWNLELSLHWAGPYPERVSVAPRCTLSDDPRRDCPDL
jgi:hypothetical protein